MLFTGATTPGNKPDFFLLPGVGFFGQKNGYFFQGFKSLFIITISNKKSYEQ